MAAAVRQHLQALLLPLARARKDIVDCGAARQQQHALQRRFKKHIVACIACLPKLFMRIFRVCNGGKMDRQEQLRSKMHFTLLRTRRRRCRNTPNEYAPGVLKTALPQTQIAAASPFQH